MDVDRLLDTFNIIKKLFAFDIVRFQDAGNDRLALFVYTDLLYME